MLSYHLTTLFILICLIHIFFLLSRHLDFFEMLRNEDELEFAKRFELVRTLTINAIVHA